MTEEEQIMIGSYCQTLMEDSNFSELITVCEKNFALEMLTTPEMADREKVYYTYQGLKSFLEVMQQFVINKDQIVSLREAEEEDKE
jgi:hypothetical protein